MHYPGSARIENSFVSSNIIVVGDGTDDFGDVVNPNLTGTLEITDSDVVAREFQAAFKAKGEVTVKQGSDVSVTNLTAVGVNALGTMVVTGGATRVETEHLTVGEEAGSNGTLTIENSSDVIVNLVALIGHLGPGTAKVLGLGALLEVGRMIVGDEAGVKGELIVQFGGHVVVRAKCEITSLGVAA